MTLHGSDIYNTHTHTHTHIYIYIYIYVVTSIPSYMHSVAIPTLADMYVVDNALNYVVDWPIVFTSLTV